VVETLFAEQLRGAAEDALAQAGDRMAAAAGRVGATGRRAKRALGRNGNHHLLVSVVLVSVVLV
jgi:hypothetical protein